MSGTFAFGAVDGAVRLGDAVALRPDVPVRLRRGLDRWRCSRINRSLKLAPASVVVPYQYTMLVWAILLGYVGVRRRARPLHARRLRHHRGGGAVHLPSRADLCTPPIPLSGPMTQPVRARRHRSDGARHLPVLLQRRARQVAARHLFGVADAGDPQRRRDAAACAVAVARGQGGARRAAAGTAARARGAVGRRVASSSSSP